MNLLRLNVKFIVWSGFGAIIVLMLTLAGIMVLKLNQQANQFSNVVKVSNSKIVLAHAMRDAIRLRSLSLNKMALSDDIFFRDDERVVFNALAHRFVSAFDKFKGYKLNETEIGLTVSVQKKVNVAFPLNQNVLDMLLSNEEVENIKPILIDALGAQEKILLILDELIMLQQLYSETAVKATEKSMDDMLKLLIVIVSVAIVFSMIVSQAVSKIVSRKNTELAEATEIKSIFLANMSHEIRTPLTAIIGFAKSQMIPNLPKDHNERATKIILRNSEHLLTVINDILDFSKIEANKLDYDYTEFSLFNLLEDVHSSLTGLISEKSIKFNINYNYPLPKIIRTDKTRLHQILMNLGGNAIKFTDKGSININVRYDNQSDNIYFDINDSGIGMTYEQQAIIFKTFSQADISTTRKYGGTGLGLTISSELVNKLGGELSVSSEIGIGSTFSFKIKNRIEELDCHVKLVNHPADYLDSKKDLTVHEKYQLVHGSILLVEDVPDNQELITFYLEEMGANVTIIDNGKKAVNITANRSFDLILMDMQMPIMGGIEATRLIRERGDKCPIVMLTANAAKEFKQECIDVGCDGFLLKPLNDKELINTVKQYLKEIESINNKDTINPDAIVSTLLKNDSHRYDKFVTKFINYLPTYVDEISENIKGKNDNKLKDVTHKLKGVGGSMGFDILSEISADFEIAIKQGNREEISRLFGQLKQAAQKIYCGKDTNVDKNSAG